MRLPRWRQTTSCSTSTARPSRVEHADDGIDGLLPDRQALLDEPGELLEQQARPVRRRASSPSAMTSLPRSETRAPARSATAPSSRSRSAPSSCASALSMGNVRVATPEWYPGRRRRPALRRYSARRARTRSCTRLPSARPAASAIASRMTAPMSSRLLAPSLAIALSTIDLEVVVGELRGQVALDQRRLALLGGRAIGVAGVLVGLGGLAAALELAPQDGLRPPRR